LELGAKHMRDAIAGYDECGAAVHAATARRQLGVL
jgi:hypothetical protein